MDIQAAKTVAITILAFLLCYIPPILFVIRDRYKSASAESRWPGFLAQFSIFISSGINPIIYCFRTRRFRSALKQFLKDPCGRSPFQETNQVQRAGQDIPRKVTRQAAANNRIINEPEAASATPKATRCATAGQGDRGLRVPGCVEEENNRNEGEASGSRKSDHVTSLSIPESERVARLAWVENNNTGSKGTSLEEEHPTPCGDYTRQGHVAVEVHPDPKDNECLQIK